jgi:hypothetical protein
MKTNDELHILVDQVMSSLLPLATNRKSFFVNDVIADTQLTADKDILAMVFGNLLRTTIDISENSCIRITANTFPDTVRLSIAQPGTRSFSDIADCMEPIQPLAQKLGGSITVINDPMTGTAVALCFHNRAKAA